MTPEFWQRLDALYGSAAELAPAARPAFLDRECAGDSALRTELEALLAAHDQAGEFLEVPLTLSLVMDSADSAHELPPAAGRRIGPFEVTETIGHGGMGVVYRAIRADDQYRQQVAIKILKQGLENDDMVRRFHTERQILASLEHPNIARLLDGGVTSDGLPYFVMEYVAGEPVDRYAAHHDLSIAARIELFRQVCAAVQFAHQNLVVHRDLKPANILVASSGIPKLLDFGIAKLLDPLSAADMTVTGMRLMTPAYASPEQARGAIITTAGDIYSLGVVLYELLTGVRPLAIVSSDPLEIARQICHEEPLKPSAAAPSALRQTLAGDLDTIILKALAKEPARRYSSAAHLSEDLRRYLDGLPVMARADTMRYRAAKFVRRHRRAVAAAAVLVLAITAGISATLWQAGVAQRERARAERRFNQVRYLANSFLFEFDDAIKNLEGTTAARQLVIQRGLQYLNSIDADSAHDPVLRREMANAYEKVSDVQGGFRMANAGDYEGALKNARKAASIRESLAAADSQDAAVRRELAASYRQLSDLLWLAQNPTEASAMSRKQLAAAQTALRLGPLDRENLKCLAAACNDQARSRSLIEGDKNGLLEYAGKAAALMEPVVAADPADLRARYLLAYSYGYEATALPDESQEGLALFRKALDMCQSLVRAEPNNINYSVATAGAYYDLGNKLVKLKDLPAARDQFRRSLDIFQRLAGADPANIQIRRHIANVLRQTGELTAQLEGHQAAIPLFQQSLAAFEALPGPPSIVVRWGIAKTQYLLAASLIKSGNRAAADPLLQKSRIAMEDMRDRKALPPPDAEFAARALAAIALPATQR